MSTKEQEAQQAQTIARVKLALNNGVAYTELKQFMRDMLEIVDSQAQKLKEQAETIATNAAYAIELQGKIAEQAREIERLKDCMFQHMDSDIYNHCQEYLEKMRGKNENKTANEIDDV